MKKRNFLTTAALAALVAAQMAMPVMAAKTNNNLDKLDTSNDYQETDLKSDGHTTFGVVEGEIAASNQLSVEVPLYVTMAATSNSTSMIVPTEYRIKNTGKPVQTAGGTQTGNIGVTAITTSEVVGSPWTIVANDGAIGDDDKKMTFNLGNHTVTEKNSTVYNDYKAVDNVNSQFVTTDGRTLDNNTLKPIAPGEGETDGLAVNISSNIAGKERKNGSGKTVGVVKVKYEFAALDSQNKPIQAVYIGDKKSEAGY